MQQETVIQQFAQRIAVRIAIDDRERSSRVKTALKRNGNVYISIKRLHLGDYQVNNTLLVERKTLADFARSVRDCRLFNQVGRLARERTMRTCLILEGGAPRSRETDDGKSSCCKRYRKLGRRRLRYC